MSLRGQAHVCPRLRVSLGVSTPALHCADGHSLRVGTKYAPLVPRDQAHPGLSQGSGTARQDPREGGGGWASGSGPLLCPLWSRVWGVTCDPSTGVCLPPTVALGFLEEEMEAVAPHVLSEPSDAAWCPIPVSLRNTGSEAPGCTPAGPSVPRGPRGISLAWTQRRGPLAGWPVPQCQAGPAQAPAAAAEPDGVRQWRPRSQPPRWPPGGSPAENWPWERPLCVGWGGGPAGQ